MILLNTNVISALMQRQPDAGVVTWLTAQPPEQIWWNCTNDAISCYFNNTTIGFINPFAGSAASH